MVVCFNGIDGSGKSLQAKRLVGQLNQAGYPAVYVWNGTRAPFTGAITRLMKRVIGVTTVPVPHSHKATSTGTEYSSYLNETQRIFKRRLVRNLWLHKALMEHTCEIWMRVLPHIRRGHIVVCDRYLYDTLINVSVLSNLDSKDVTQLLPLLSLYRVPQPTNWFFLDVPAEVGFQRKDDVPDLLFLERRVPLYRTAAITLGMQWLDGTAGPDEIAAIVWQSVRASIQRVPVAVCKPR